MARKSRKNLPQPEPAAVSVLLPEPEEMKVPAAIYGRLSVEDDEKEESMETQIALVQDYINRSSELSYVDTYFDNGFTGTNFKRPAFTRLMNDVRQKKIKCIVVKDLSRFGRNYLEAGYYIETVFPFLGVRLIAVTDNFDSNAQRGYGKSGSPDSEYGQRDVRERHIQKDMDFLAAQKRSRLCCRKRCSVWLYSEPRDKAQ